MLVDTHCHLNMMVKDTFGAALTPDEIAKAQTLVAEAQASGVGAFINAGTCPVESQNSVALAKAIPSVWALVAIHPHDCKDDWQEQFAVIKKLVEVKEANKIVGIGECGIDRHYPEHNLAHQTDAFRAHIELALQHDLPLIVHSRDAYEETLHALDEYKGDLSRGIIHCFSYDQEFANHVVRQGFVIGLAGNLTYPRNDELRDIAQALPIDKIVLETDAPFMPPQEIRGERNHPKYVRAVAEQLAQTKGVPLETVARDTAKTACAVFGPAFTAFVADQ